MAMSSQVQRTPSNDATAQLSFKAIQAMFINEEAKKMSNDIVSANRTIEN